VSEHRFGLDRRQAGHDAEHVARVGKAGWKDWNVVRHVAEGDFVVFTNNASDFRRLYAVQPLHAGLVIIIPSVNRVEQQQLFLGALDDWLGSGSRSIASLRSILRATTWRMSG
jgi:hypothetical protein